MKLEQLNVGPALFLVGYHLALFVLLPIYLWNSVPAIGILALSVGLFFLSGFSITAGYHRYYAHRAYEPSWPVEWFMMFFGTLAVEGSVLEWAHDHRNHHKFVDTEKDPYNIKDGFWHAHILWMFETQDRDFDDVVPDLQENPLLRFQHKHYSWLSMGLNGAVTVGAGLFWADLFGALVFVFLARLFLLHHATWFINSLAHTWGVKPFSREQTAVNNFIISILTFGEGYHNYHHTFASDYRNGVWWYQFDPTKIIIWALSKVGLARNLNRVNRATIQKRMIDEDRKMMLKCLETTDEEETEDLRQRVISLYDSLKERLQEIKEIKDNQRINDLKQKISQDWSRWTELCEKVLSMKPDSVHVH